MLAWMDAREAKEFGASLAAVYIAQVPVDLNVSDKKFAARTESAMRKMSSQVTAFKAAHKLNPYKKAQLGNTFKWALKDAGYGAEYLDKLTDWLMTRL